MERKERDKPKTWHYISVVVTQGKHLQNKSRPEITTSCYKRTRAPTKKTLHRSHGFILIDHTSKLNQINLRLMALYTRKTSTFS